MLSFAVHQVEVGLRRYLLLPKLNRRQVGLLGDRLCALGYEIEKGQQLAARSGEGSVFVHDSGLCWGTSDLADAILPSMPRVLRERKEPLSQSAIAGLYVTGESRGHGGRVRLSSRLESGPLWDRLRGTGVCGLAPDEHLVASRLLASSMTPCRMLTDFPVEGSKRRRFGAMTYFESELSGEAAAATLRRVGEKKARNSYLPRDAVLSITTPPGALLETELTSGLGEWCSFETRK